MTKNTLIAALSSIFVLAAPAFAAAQSVIMTVENRSGQPIQLLDSVCASGTCPSNIPAIIAARPSATFTTCNLTVKMT